jgi:diguanylate cyclase (GGDEF)-like protein
MRRSLSVRARVMLSVAAMLLPMLALAGISTLAMEGTLDRFTGTADEALDDTIPLVRLQGLVLRVERNGLYAVWNPEEEALTRYERAKTEMVAGFDSLQKEALTEERGLVARASGSAQRTVLAFDVFLATRPENLELAPSAQTTQQSQVIQLNTDAAVEALERAERISRADMLSEYAAAKALEGRTRTAVIAIALLGLLIAVAGGFVLARSVVRPLHRLREAVGVLSDGALSHRVELDRRDEFAEFGDALNEMAADLERSQGDLAHQALHDALTGLPNRVLLGDRLEQALVRGRRKGMQLALVLIDLDGFKGVNDTLGHEVGDEVLRSAAERLRLCLRQGDTAARLGGDEFAILVDADSPGQALGVAERILRSMRPAFTHAGRDLFLTASVGVAFADGRANGPELLRSADLAMYRAKHGGKDRVCVYDPSMHGAADDRLRLEGDLRGALQRGELSLHYQPVYSLDGTSLVGVEALMRWDHPERGMVPPMEFIPLAEQSGLIGALGAWALDEGCRQLRHWQDTVAGAVATELKLSVNLSARQLTDSALPTVVSEALKRHRIEPYRLMLEITESTMVSDVAATIGRLEELKKIGVQLAIDDFGTGYSSLAYLQQFPIDQIKIDKTFVDRISSPEGQALAEGIINMARALTLEPIAEGIEDADQLAALDRLGCRLGQGYHFARPESGADLGHRLATAPRVTAA